jgi:aryl-alcohol dehydrogenase-like predicted oxidoreductase
LNLRRGSEEIHGHVATLTERWFEFFEYEKDLPVVTSRLALGRNGIAFIPWFPLGAGKAAGDVLNQIAQAHRASTTQVALAWLLRRSLIMQPIPGTSSIEHLEQNVAAASLRLSGEEYEELSRVPELVGTRG